jgi:hypothetical protein
MEKLSPTGKHLCSRCQKLATYRLPGLNRITNEVFYAYQCEEHALKESEPMFDETAITSTIEDLEMDAMMQESDYINARELAKERQLVTAEMLHNAFAKVERTANTWVNLSQEQVVNYGLMAEYLNDAIELKQNLTRLNADLNDYEVHITDAQRRESQGWKAAADLATEYRNWSGDAQEAGVEEYGDQ